MLRNEAKLLSAVENVDMVYMTEVMPNKMKYNLMSIQRFSLISDMATMMRTIFAVLGKEYE